MIEMWSNNSKDISQLSPETCFEVVVVSYSVSVELLKANGA